MEADGVGCGETPGVEGSGPDTAKVVAVSASTGDGCEPGRGLIPILSGLQEAKGGVKALSVRANLAPPLHATGNGVHQGQVALVDRRTQRTDRLVVPLER